MNATQDRTITPELLSPAGDWESMRAAVANGADAVYFGLSQYSARARATNFTLDELPDVMEFLHRHAVRGFAALNTLIFTDELPDIVEFVQAVANAGVDAVIVQDLGLVRLIRAMVPSLPVHGSTQMTLTEPAGIHFVQKLGVQRVVLARELSLDDIRKVTSQTDMPVEVFVHGALCVAYSGQCLTSEALGGRSANRGQCAQACRLPYEMIVDGKPMPLGDRAYLLSPQDLAAYEQIRPLIDTGVISFKIEGRLKGGPYVAATTQTYRAAIDAATAGEKYELSRQGQLDLAQSFSRGLTPGFLEGVNHQKLVRGRFPKSRGVRVARVLEVVKDTVRLELQEDVEDLLEPGDGVVFDLGKPEQKEPGGRIWHLKPVRTVNARHPVVDIRFEAGVDLSGIPRGCDVWRTDDQSLRKRLESSYSREEHYRRVPVTARVEGAVDGPLTLTLSTASGITATATWPGPLQRAQKRATTREDIHSQLERLGDTPFMLKTCQLEMTFDLMIPRSVLNDIRRQAADRLTKKWLESQVHSIASPAALAELRAKPAPGQESPVATATPQLTVLARNLDQLQAVLNWQPPEGLSRPAMVYADFEDLKRYKEAVALAGTAGMPLALATLRISKPGEEGFHSLIVRAEPDFVLVRSLAAIEHFRKELPHTPQIGDYSLNIANDLTARLFHETGLIRQVPSFDLNWEQFQALMRQSDPNWFEPVVHQHMPMFHMEHCVFAAFLSKGKDHRDCGRPCEKHRIELRDRIGSAFPVHPDTGCRNTVFNSVAQSAVEYLDQMRQLGVSRFRIDLLRESASEVAVLLEQYSRLIAGQKQGKEIWKQLKVLNQLGVTRGTLNLL